jgi:Sensors of blue-light using FAD
MVFAQLLYVSRSLLPPGRSPDLLDILDSAARSNKALDLTGCLASCGHWFIQFLEGPPESIAVAMKRIEADARHTDITVRLRREVGARSFPRWHMAHIEDGPDMAALGDPMKQPVVVLLSELMRLAESRGLDSSA